MEIFGKVFVVTGGGNGIGRELVLDLLRHGAQVAAIDVSADGLAETVELAKAGDALSIHRVDITDRAAVQALLPAVKQAHGAVDGLVNVAGIIHKFTDVDDLTFEAIERVVNVNLWGVINTVKVFLPELKTRPEASIVNVSSMGALVVVPGQTVYGATKAAVKLFTEGLYAELQGTNVAVTAVYPGAIDTGIMEHSHVEMAGSSDLRKKTPMTSPKKAAALIVRGIEKGSYRVLIGLDARGLDSFSRVTPRLATTTVAKAMRKVLGM